HGRRLDHPSGAGRYRPPAPAQRPRRLRRRARRADPRPRAGHVQALRRVHPVQRPARDRAGDEGDRAPGLRHRRVGRLEISTTDHDDSPSERSTWNMTQKRSIAVFGVTCLAVAAWLLTSAIGAAGQAKPRGTAKAATTVIVTAGKPSELAFKLSKFSNLPA